ncbi:HBL/NHE enterotoxin family protein [Chryseobacterium viscerum]|uniref:Uncharacterized protein n=1 Tax=Chryseobacterium viscerum TaxID=1037377 RepID=A0A316WC91_9FLAO|nr:HBL/NHE enterotoxin family protein [Chryseobacterium viscerum]PWN57953.1 hypothetical protein C1634_025205 [Chryseobacterium viscerum]
MIQIVNTNTDFRNPDISQEDLKQTASSATVVTNYAQASITAVPVLRNMPDWYVPINTDIKTVQGNSRNWISQICPRISRQIPQTIIDFNGQFQRSGHNLGNIFGAISKQPSGKPTIAQRKSVTDLLSDILAQVNTQQKNVTETLSAVSAYVTTVNNNQQMLANDLSIATSKFLDGAKSVAEMTAVIGENFIDNNILGPCSVIVNINMNISLKVSGLNINPALITIIYAKAILENQLGNMRLSQLAVQNILDAWAITHKKFELVISDLNDAADDDYASCFKQLDFEVAQRQWQQLADFAQNLMTT